MPTLTIDNQQVTVAEGTTVLEAAEQLGIVIPHFCYHKALKAVGACRMCAVTVEKGSQTGLKMSCLVPVEDDMVVTTGDENSAAFRSSVIEWLMLNHPHDCPVCDEGGECQLQEMTIAGGHGIRRYGGKKRTYTNQDLGPYIVQEMNRCIQCYRCVRTYQDYCGGRDFGVMGSRNRIFFGRFEDGMLESDFSGNLVDVCPTGVFTDKTYRFKTRYWDLQEAPSICPHCSLGCATIPGGRYREMQRVRSGVNLETNGYFICDRGRFGSDYVNHPARPRQARSGEQLVAVEDALRQVEVQARELIDRHGPDAVLLLGSHRASLETNWLLQQWSRQLGCRPPLLGAHGRRHRTAQIAAGELSASLASLEQVRQSDLVVVLGADPLVEAPMLAVALRQTVRDGGQVMVYDPRPVELPCQFDHQALSPQGLRELLTFAKGVETDMLRDLLQKAAQPVIVAGGDLLGPEGFQQVNRIASVVSNAQRRCLVFPLLGGPNSFGAALLGDPDEEELSAQLGSGRVKMLVCCEIDPLLEVPGGEGLTASLTDLQLLAALDCLPTPFAEQASVFLPTTGPTESSGTFVNNEGRLQVFAPVLDPGLPIAVTGDGGHPPREFSTTTPGSEPQPAWQLLCQLLGWSDDLAALRKRMAEELPRLVGLNRLDAGDPGLRVAATETRASLTPAFRDQPEGTLQLVVSPAAYGGELFGRYSAKLKPRFSGPLLSLHPDDARHRGLHEGERVVLDCDAGSFHLPLHFAPAQARGCALVVSSPDFPHLLAGAEISFCAVSREVGHE